MDLKVKDITNSKVYDKPPPNNMSEEERVWHLKRNQFIKCLNAGWKLPEDIIEKYKLRSFVNKCNEGIG